MNQIKLEKNFLKEFEIQESQKIEERDHLSRLANTINRYNVNNCIMQFGVARVFRVLAATIKRNPSEYDSEVVAVARQVPPLKPGRDWESWFFCPMHRMLVQENFMEIARLRAE